MTDTIAAIATPFGSGGIGVIRISGPESFDLAGQIFSLSRQTFVPAQKLADNRTARHGWIMDPDSGDIMDEVLLIPMKGPASYTAEDVVEIQAHAGTLVLRKILDLVLALGARLSEPGEFTRRAFLNGRIDLTQAEAVMDIINAKSANALKFAAAQNTGTLKNDISQLRETLVVLLARVEVDIDFPDEAQAFKPTSQDLALADQVLEACRTFIQRHDDACFLKDGIRITICGAPNVGKSSLMNRLLNQERAIVTQVPGTTRDPIEEGLNMDGIPFVLSDTAGIHQTDDLVEIIGIEKARDHIQKADIVLFMKEAGTTVTDQEFETVVRPDDPDMAGAPRKILFVVNKIDLEPENLPQLSETYKDVPRVEISALENRGIDRLRQAILDMSMAGLDLEKSSVIPNLRHKKALEQAVQSLETAREGLSSGLEPELLAIDIKNSIDALGTITGETASLDILDTVFDRFCIGK